MPADGLEVDSKADDDLKASEGRTKQLPCLVLSLSGQPKTNRPGWRFEEGNSEKILQYQQENPKGHLQI